MMVATAEVQAMKTYESPDFYWKYRLERLAGKKSGDLALSESNYPCATSPKDLYDAYYLDLTLQGKMQGFDWVGEKVITDAEWLSIYKNICTWSTGIVAANKPDAKNLPVSDFDLLKQFYPQLNYRELETSFSAEEVGDKFPYKNMKDLMTAAVAGDLNVPGYSKSSVTSLEATEVRAELKSLKEETMKKVDAIYEQTMTYANNAFPDAQSKTHYQALKKRLADFPTTSAGWSALRSNMEKEVDEMARLASKRVDEHHGHHDEEEGHGHGEKKASPAQEFEAKYGRNLDEMQERMALYKTDPEGFLQASIFAKYGKEGLDVWKKSQEFSAQMSVMSEADKAATEASFTNFLNQA
jgi:hypothetical protein